MRLISYIYSQVHKSGPQVFGQWHNFHNFSSVHHYNGFEIKQSRLWLKCRVSALIQGV